MTTQTATAPVTARTCSPERRITRSLLGYGPLAGTVFVGSIFIQGLTRRGFSIPHDDASLLAKPDAMLRRAEKWRPWRSVASWYLWRACDLAGKKMVLPD